LLHVVRALHAGRGLADLLDCGEEQADQDRDDRDYDQQLDQRETRFSLAGPARPVGQPSSFVGRLGLDLSPI
jgi:hypothetical protein